MAVTLAQLAGAKKLTPEYLSTLGITPVGRELHMPYYDYDGAVVLYRRRTAISGTKGTRDLEGAQTLPYGRNRLDLARESGYLIVVEGESDCWTLWHAGYAALGIPGASRTACLESRDLEGVPQVYVVREPGQSGQTFVPGVLRRLEKIGYRGEISELSCGDAKDPSDLWIADPKKFKRRLDKLLSQVVPLTLPVPDPPRRPAPAPSANGQAAEPHAWEEWIPLSTVGIPPTFPLEVLPSILRDFCGAVAEACDAPVDYVAVQLLTVAGAAIGASRCVCIKAGWWERPLLWTAVVAPPSSGKSPAQDAVAAPAYAQQRRLHDEYRRKKREWNKEKEGPPPKHNCVYVKDITVESLAPVLADNLRGLVSLQDELGFLLKGMNQYRAGGKGNDKEFWNAAWGGTSILVHRKGQEDGPILVPFPFCAITGCIPPSELGAVGANGIGRDGHLDRWLFGYPNPLPMQGEDWISVHPGLAAEWSEIWHRLCDLEMEKHGDDMARPRVLPFTVEAQHAWEDWTTQHAAEGNDPAFPEHMKGPHGKLKRYLPRFACIIQGTWHAAGVVREEDISGNAIEKAGLLADYFAAGGRRVYACLGADPRQAKAKEVLSWLERRKGERVFRRAEAYRELRAHFEKPEQMDGPLDLLIAHRFIREIAEQQEIRRGRPCSTAFEVSPQYTKHLMHEIH